MADIFVYAFMIYSVIAVTFGLSLLLYSWYLSVKYSKDDSPWTDWHDIGECDICGRDHIYDAKSTREVEDYKGLPGGN